MGDLTKEGKAEVYLPTSVFYNPVQEFNRDLTIATISQHARDHIRNIRTKREKQANNKENAERANVAAEALKNTVDPDNLEAGVKYEDGLRILEGLAASGLRSVRFAKEIPGIKEVIANDFDRTAVEFIQKNVDHNKVGHLVHPNCADAAMVMYENRQPSERFDVIDLDPYGSPVAFLDGAVQALADGGLLCVTCTDVAILCGNSPETCYSKYGAVPLKSKYCHEMALRIVLQTIEAHANRYSRYVEPLLSVSVDFYVRLFVRMHTGQHYVKRSVAKMALVYSCIGCGSFYLQPMAKQTHTKGDNYKFTPALAPTVGELCEECGYKFHIGGPVWAAPIHDKNFVDQIISNVRTPSVLGTSERIKGMLTLIHEELPDVPFFFVIDNLSKILHCEAPPLLSVRSAIMNAGYEVSLSHTAKASLKTTAPNHIIWDIFRCWIKDHPVNLKNMKEGTPGRPIVLREPKISVSFEVREDANPKSRKSGLVRWQQNPERDWGPKPRAKRGGALETLDDRREKGKIKAYRAQAAKRKAHTQGELGAPDDKRLSTGSGDAGDENMNVDAENTNCTDDAENTKDTDTKSNN